MGARERAEEKGLHWREREENGKGKLGEEEEEGGGERGKGGSPCVVNLNNSSKL